MPNLVPLGAVFQHAQAHSTPCFRKCGPLHPLLAISLLEPQLSWPRPNCHTPTVSVSTACPNRDFLLLQHGFGVMPNDTCYCTWTRRDLDLVECLALRVNLLSLAQIAAGWWPGQGHPIAYAQRRASQLVAGKLLQRYIVPAHPLLDLNEPVFHWSPGQAPPQCEPVSWRLRRRWNLPSERTAVFAASKLAANLFASYAGKRVDSQHATHDLHVGQVYLWYQRAGFGPGLSWLGENAFPKAGFRIKDPDAFLVNSDGDPIRVIEFGGRYDAQRVADFHRHCLERDLSYELW